MKISFWSIGKAHDPYVKEGITEFTKRISRYFPVEWQIIPVPKHAASLEEAELRKREAALVLQMLRPDDYLLPLDERGREFSSEELAAFLNQRAGDRTRNIVFLIGGAYGLHPDLLSKAKFSWSLSRLTFPHQLVRLILAEQVYRACTILQNEKYHHK